MRMMYLDSANHLLSRSSAGKERNEKRNSTGSTILSTVGFHSPSKLIKPQINQDIFR